MIPLALLKLAGTVAPYALAAGVALTAYQVAPVVGVNAQRHHLEHARDGYHDSAVAWHKNRDGWKINADGWHASFTKSETFRKSDQADAIRSVEAETAACSVRVAEARKSAEAIKRIVNKPVKVDANQCPVRETVSADDLKAALGAR